MLFIPAKNTLKLYPELMLIMEDKELVKTIISSPEKEMIVSQRQGHKKKNGCGNGRKSMHRCDNISRMVGRWMDGWMDG